MNALPTRRHFLAAAPFLKALPGWRYEFPRDHFSHPDFRTEWWYYTGNLQSAGRPFGFELTFFRQAIQEEAAGKSLWSPRDVWMAHLALTDVQGKQFLHAERLNRSGPGLAGVSDERQRIWNGNWSCELKPDKHRLQATDPRFAFTLDLSPAKAPVTHGQNGVSQKGPQPGQASHYISFTRLQASGAITLGGQRLPVQGSAWMDHEIFSSELDPTLAGWDWFSIQFDNNTELMLYRLRLKDGRSSEYSAGTFVDAQGRATHLNHNEFQLTPGRRWKSYPVEWRLAVPRLNIDIAATPRLDDQELLSPSRLTPSYWEGAMQFQGTHNAVGYLEMTGYDEAIRFQPNTGAVRK
jgi:predicted secreted hydrolase